LSGEEAAAAGEIAETAVATEEAIATEETNGAAAQPETSEAEPDA
jgi:hypothetical protein